MKSTPEALLRRGMPAEADLARAARMTGEELLREVREAPPAACTAALRTLRQSGCVPDSALTEYLLTRLEYEKALYTRLEICALLETGGEETAAILCARLGRIGKNQHTEVPHEVSHKAGYPLARDLAARTLANMGAAALSALLDVLANGDERKICEALDAFGWIVYHDPRLATAENLASVLRLLERNPQNRLLRWKGIVCLSAFPLRAGTEALEAIAAGQDARLAAETERSLVHVRRRMDR